MTFLGHFMADNWDSPKLRHVRDLLVTIIWAFLPNHTFTNSSIRYKSLLRLCWKPRDKIKCCHPSKSWHIMPKSYRHRLLPVFVGNCIILRSLGKMTSRRYSSSVLTKSLERSLMLSDILWKLRAPDAFPLTRWKSMINPTFPCYTQWAPQILVDRRLRDNWYLNILKRMSITPIRCWALLCPSKFWIPKPQVLHFYKNKPKQLSWSCWPKRAVA